MISEKTQNKVYAQLFMMDIEQVRACKSLSWKLAHMGAKYMAEFERQCDFVIARKMAEQLKKEVRG